MKFATRYLEKSVEAPSPESEIQAEPDVLFLIYFVFVFSTPFTTFALLFLIPWLPAPYTKTSMLGPQKVPYRHFTRKNKKKTIKLSCHPLQPYIIDPILLCLRIILFERRSIYGTSLSSYTFIN